MKFLTKSTLITVVCLALAVASFGVLPGLAQDNTVQNADTTTIVTGAVSFGADGSIIVAGVTIDPAGAFNPSNLKEGDLVVITGAMLNETTLQATGFEFFEDDQQPEATPEATLEITPEATVEMTPEATLEITPEATLESTPELTAEPTEVAAGCNQPNQPVAMKIAATFNVSYDEVMAMHCDGNGFGEIVRAYALAAASTDGTTAADYLARHKAGEGWGKIVHESNVNPSDLAPGRVLKDHGDDGSVTATPEANTSTKPGNGNGNGGNGGGNGNGNGGNGGGNGHGNGGNGGGNGNGNGGNGGGNGNGNGNGGGKGHGG
jgi:hypothetical protein